MYLWWEPGEVSWVFPGGRNSLSPGEVHEGFSEEVVGHGHACSFSVCMNKIGNLNGDMM